MNIREYVDCTDQNLRKEFELHIFDNVFYSFLFTLPLNPPEIDFGDKSMIIPDVWTDGTEILCRDEELAEMIANALDAISGEHESHTGYYDPFEDAQSGETDDHTGWWYVDFD